MRENAWAAIPDGYTAVRWITYLQVIRKSDGKTVGNIAYPYDPQSLEWWVKRVQDVIKEGA